MQERLPVTESCTQCPHFDEFHGTCGHPLRQSVIHELSTRQSDACTLFPEIRADAMQTLENDGITGSLR